jgi:hypothetical protein
VKSPTLIMAGGKMWGQHTDDGRYAISYNPIELDEYRYPLIIISGDDGIVYDNMLLVQGEVPPRRFFGRWKDFGPCYVRGIVEGNGNPPGNDMWLTYSMNKEDMWVSRVPVPIMYKIHGDVKDNFEDMEPGKSITDWNTYSTLWAPVDLIKEENNICIRLKDKDPYDYARAIRVFEEAQQTEISFRIKVEKATDEPFEIDMTDRYGNRPVRIGLDRQKNITAVDGSDKKIIGKFSEGTWVNIKMRVDAKPYGDYSVWIDGNLVASGFQLAEAVKSVERVSFRTGSYRDLPNRKTPNEDPEPPLPGADDPVSESVYLLDDLSVIKIR